MVDGFRRIFAMQENIVIGDIECQFLFFGHLFASASASAQSFSIRSSVSVRSVAQISASAGEMPKAASPITAWVIVTIEKSGCGGKPEPRSVKAGINSDIARIGETPCSGEEACAVLPEKRILMPRDAQLTGPSTTLTWPNGRPEDCEEKRNNPASSRQSADRR